MSRPPPARPQPEPSAPAQGVLIRADNGDVVTFDETGLTLRLSDRMIADLRQRLALPAPVPPAVAARLGDIDAWGLRQTGDWLTFSARLERDRPPRDFQMPMAGGDIIAAAPGPLLALFSLGGARRAGFNDGPPGFAFHILAPGDDIGAVGLEGSADAQPTAALQKLPHCSRDTLIAQTLLTWRYQALRGLPLFVTRTETDGAASLAALAQGRAYRNFLAALDSLVAAAATLGKPAKVLAVGLEFGIEDQHSDAGRFAADLRDLLTRIERDMFARNLQRPIFVLTAEAGTAHVTSHPAMQAHWQLAWSHGPHHLAISAPGYMFEQTEFGRPTAAARLEMAEMDAHAIVALSNRKPWLCPLPLLAEAEGATVRVTFQAMSDLQIDDALGAGPAGGFALEDPAGPLHITSVSVAGDDARSLLLACDRAPASAGAVLRYAQGAAGPATDGFPANRGAVRDSWSAQSQSRGRVLHRWALPALLPVHPGAR